MLIVLLGYLNYKVKSNDIIAPRADYTDSCATEKATSMQHFRTSEQTGVKVVASGHGLNQQTVRVLLVWGDV